ncbi:hypothetical protein NEOLEDRAFT_1167102 [Neolentinus lepideus HHB14362 ss-1]|uniref:Uncharacterized protein n=1 Tax=Neolentinus lepideus HHB14362 ss-1 TaxID=1314782 RepID=A0A165V2R3_9AGAM|nr:hypothetical protein NEOLEDRAFT_1167102 [Neolentinus lepideus HHB14362 ss-1]
MAECSPSPFAAVHADLLKIGAIPLEEYLFADGPVLQPVWDVSSGLNMYMTPLGETKAVASSDEDSTLDDQGSVPPFDSGGGPIERIADCCREWRAGLVEPLWLRLSDPKLSGKYGFALQIKLSPSCQRSYSVDTIYESVEEAQRSCATLAIDQGALDFIKYGGGQTQPAPRTSEVRPADDPRKTYASLQDFFDAFPPKSLTLPGGVENLSDFNPSKWFNTAIQTAHAKLQEQFIPVIQSKAGTRSSFLYGCVLRLTRPSAKPLTYIVEPVLEKKSDIKPAVCLEAISQGVADYISSVTKDVENKVTPDMRRLVSGHVLPILNVELRKIPNAKIDFDYSMDLDGRGCTLTITIAADPENITSEEVRSFTVPPDFKDNKDAKVAVLYLANSAGVIEFVRARMPKPPPPSGDSSSKDVPAASKKKKKKRKRNKAVEPPSPSDPGPSGNKRAKHDYVPDAELSSTGTWIPGPQAPRATGPNTYGGPVHPYHSPNPYIPPMYPYPPPLASQFAPPGYCRPGPHLPPPPMPPLPPQWANGSLLPPQAASKPDAPRYSYGYR